MATKTSNTSKVADNTRSSNTPSTTDAGKAALRAIDGNIKKIKASFLTARDLVQTTIVMIARHAKDDGRGDVSRFAMLLDAMPEFAKRAGVINHVQKFSSIRATKNSKTGLFNAHLAIELDENGKATGKKVHVTAEMVDALEANKWWEDERSRDTPNEFALGDALDSCALEQHCSASRDLDLHCVGDLFRLLYRFQR